MRNHIKISVIESFLYLVRLGIGHPVHKLDIVFDWVSIQELSYEQGLSAVVLDGIDNMPVKKRPPKDFTLQWIGDVIHSYEHRYDSYCHALADLANFYNSHEFKMMILKGFACSLNWPKPEHRPCGDIDIWLFGKQRDADSLLKKENKVPVDNSHHHHTVFNWADFTVENHYDFINIHKNKTNTNLERLLKELGSDDSYFYDILGERVYLPSPNLHALFLVLHMRGHFAAQGITLRQILDWGFWAEAHQKEIDWIWLEGILRDYGIINIYNIFNTICVYDLGFDKKIFPNVNYNQDLKEIVLKEILFPKYNTVLPNNYIKRVVYKLQRWRGNIWKYKLCYKESNWEIFWTGIWSHILKPSSI